MKYRLFLFVLFCCLGITGCVNAGDDKLDSLIAKYCVQKIEPRDSIYITYTVRQWRNIEFYYWHDESKMFKLTNEDIKPYIYAIFYSPDRKKMVCWYGEKTPNADTKISYSDEKKYDRICPTGGDTFYHLNPLVGIRDSINQPWTIREFSGMDADCGRTNESCAKMMSEHFFVKLKDAKIHVVIQDGVDKGKIVWKSYGYNIQDPEFWEKCPMWQKDTVGSDGLYSLEEFKLKEQWRDYEKGYPCYKCYMGLNYPKINYPKEILDMYK